MKLEAKHLVPYLTHKLKAKNCFNEIVEVRGIQFGNESCNNVLWSFVKNGDYLQGYLYQCKPFLRPLSDLTKEIEVNGEKFIPIEYLKSNYPCFGFDYNEDDGFILNTDVVNYKYLPYMILYKLFEWHLDVFGLTEKGLAIDINTL